jgi:hypothetical protein
VKACTLSETSCITATWRCNSDPVDAFGPAARAKITHRRGYCAAAKVGLPAAGRSATAAYVFHSGVRSSIFCAERVNDFPLLRRRRFGRCGFTRGNRGRHLIVASKPRSGLGYRLALRGLCDRGLGKQAK